MLSPCYIVFWSLMARIAGCIQYLDLLVNHYYYIQFFFYSKNWHIYFLYIIRVQSLQISETPAGPVDPEDDVNVPGYRPKYCDPPSILWPAISCAMTRTTLFLAHHTHLTYTDSFCPSAMFFIKRCTVSLGMKLVSSAWKLVPTLWPGQISMLFPAAWPQLNGNALPVYTYTAYFCTPECLMAMYYQF